MAFHRLKSKVIVVLDLNHHRLVHGPLFKVYTAFWEHYKCKQLKTTSYLTAVGNACVNISIPHRSAISCALR